VAVAERPTGGTIGAATRLSWRRGTLARARERAQQAGAHACIMRLMASKRLQCVHVALTSRRGACMHYEIDGRA
jgi:hypothetical protein